MEGGRLIREARKRAGLTQVELAGLLGTTQPVIARWEGGRSSPSLERVVDAVRACGLDLAIRIVARDDDHALLIEEMLSRSPAERLERITTSRSSIEWMRAATRKS